MLYDVYMTHPVSGHIPYLVLIVIDVSMRVDRICAD